MFKLIVISLIASSVQANYMSDHEGKVEIASDKNHLVEIQFETYIENVLGFKSFPVNDDENFKWKTLQLKWFKENKNYLQLPNICKVEQSEIEFTKDKRSVVLASILYQCSRKIKMKEVEFNFFNQFPRIKSLEISARGESKASKRTLKSSLH